MNFNIAGVLEYTNWILKKYHEVNQKHDKNVYRVVDIKNDGQSYPVLLVQIIGKSAVIECTANEIVKIDWLIEGFSKKDIRTITYLACLPKRKAKYNIITQEFTEEEQILFKIKQESSDYTVSKTAAEIINDPSLLEGLNKADIKSISYTAGYEASQRRE